MKLHSVEQTSLCQCGRFVFVHVNPDGTRVYHWHNVDDSARPLVLCELSGRPVAEESSSLARAGDAC